MFDLNKYLSDIKALCAAHRVRHLYVFGSALTDKFNTKSDVDFIVDFEPIEVALYADNYYDLKFALQDILHKPIDLLEEKAMKNPYFNEAVNRHKALIYGY